LNRQFFVIAMEISPMRAIRAVGEASTPKNDREVQPPFAFDPAGRMEDDAYQGNDHSLDRGLEEEDLAEAEESEEGDDQSATLSDRSDAESEVDFFA
jgi:hypothetical protein